MDRIDERADDRMSSLELGDLTALFESDRFPVDTETLIEEDGEQPVGYPEGEEPLADILRRSGMETYETPDELQLAIMNGVDRDAVGRPAYSDRGDELAGDGSRQEQSL
jgi:hypothetical protein